MDISDRQMNELTREVKYQIQQLGISLGYLETRRLNDTLEQFLSDNGVSVKQEAIDDREAASSDLF